jgi:GntR family transcriptional regulator, transcriptional repressor for pyruvate dehydrogenase complex
MMAIDAAGDAPERAETEGETEAEAPAAEEKPALTPAPLPASAGADASAGEVRSSMPLLTRRPLKRSEMIAQDLVAYIVDSRLPPGARLPHEKEMIEQIGVGRTSLREALRILETRGVVTIKSGPGGGPVVRHPQPTDLTESFKLILQFQRGTMAEVLDARAWLEPLAARLAATNITRNEIARLHEINAEIEADVDTEEKIMDANQRFHSVIAGSTANLVVQVYTETLMAIADEGIGDLNHSRDFRRGIIKGHQKIIEALEAKDPDAAETAMREHIVEAKERRLDENRALMNRSLRWVE